MEPSGSPSGTKCLGAPQRAADVWVCSGMPRRLEPHVNRGSCSNWYTQCEARYAHTPYLCLNFFVTISYLCLGFFVARPIGRHYLLRGWVMHPCKSSLGKLLQTYLKVCFVGNSKSCQEDMRSIITDSQPCFKCDKMITVRNRWKTNIVKGPPHIPGRFWAP